MRTGPRWVRVLATQAELPGHLDHLRLELLDLRAAPALFDAQLLLLALSSLHISSSLTCRSSNSASCVASLRLERVLSLRAKSSLTRCSTLTRSCSIMLTVLDTAERSRTMSPTRRSCESLPRVRVVIGHGQQVKALTLFHLKFEKTLKNASLGQPLQPEQRPKFDKIGQPRRETMERARQLRLSAYTTNSAKERSLPDVPKG
ncbi:hypothetical protein C8J57DRAFT_1213448 [Mycena rebaudengoi]|nr:hypothetical protein C8J57DRAFT_1213448 [Mycena rebaudengoi]